MSIGSRLEPGRAAGALLKPSAVGISRAAGARTHGIGPAVAIRTRLDPGAAAEPLPGHGAVITRSLGSAIVRRPPWRSNIPGHVSAAALVSGSRDVGSGCRCVSIGPTPTRRKDVGGAASVTAAVAGAAAVTAAAGSAAAGS